MSTESKSTPSVRGKLAVAAAIAGSVLVAFIVDATQGGSDGSVPISSEPVAAEQQLPPDHPPVGGVQALDGADQQLPPGHPPIDGQATPDGHDDTACGSGQDDPALPAGHPPTKQQAEGQQTVAPGSIAAAQGEGAVTVSVLIGQAERYEGKKVRIAAKVLRSTQNVLGKNWLHIGDGSGSPEKGDHDLVVTTQADVQVGQLVTVEGIVSRNKDLGSGYRYDVLVEDARVTPLQEG